MQQQTRLRYCVTVSFNFLGKSGEYSVRCDWLRTGFATVLILATGSLSWAQQSNKEAALSKEIDARGAALADCLWKNARRLADGKIPTQAEADAAISICAPEEEAAKKSLLKVPGLRNGVIPDGPYAGIGVDLIVLCNREHIVWKLVGFDERLRRDESIPPYRVDPRCL